MRNPSREPPLSPPPQRRVFSWPQLSPLPRARVFLAAVGLLLSVSVRSIGAALMRGRYQLSALPGARAQQVRRSFFTATNFLSSRFDRPVGVF